MLASLQLGLQVLPVKILSGCQSPTVARGLATASLCAVLAYGCVTGRPVQPPRDVPAAFEHGATSGGGQWPAQDWYRGFGSDELDKLVELAVANNWDLTAARERVAQADARARQAGAALLPSVSGNANANYLAGSTPKPPGQMGSGHELDWFAVLSASYEGDFWGRNRATAQAARPPAPASEAKLQAANAHLAAAGAAMLPSLTLTASGGVQNPVLPGTINTISGAGPSGAVAANLTQVIFDHGKLRAQRDETLARERELLATYREAVLAALVDVEKALSALEHLKAVAEFQRVNVNESERAFEGARVRYERGSGDFLTLLELQRTLYAARDQFTQYKLARLHSLVALCKALGGGWSG